MTDEADLEADDSFTGPEPKSSRAVLSALRKAEDAFREWQADCQNIDEIYNYGRALAEEFDLGDTRLDLFWSSFEVMKVAVYARPPQPVVAPLFRDGRKLEDTSAELLERCAVSVLKRTGIDDTMKLLRDDLLFAGRGSPWVRHEVDRGEHGVCIEHKDRLDFLHEPARKWCEVGWVAGASWMTRKDMRKRFRKASGDAYKDAQYTLDRGRDADDRDLEKRASARKAKVWEVWHKADDRVYWVTEGVDVFLDESEPEIEFADFFPCPKPAYATLKRRSLVPVPDYDRYRVHFAQINELTRRIYSLLASVRMKGLIPAGGDVADAVAELLRADNDDQIIVPVPQAALTAGGKDFVAWLPLVELATAIQGLIEARNQLIMDFYQLSGISDIMRGATEAEETLGAQQLKAQFGSVRVREKSAELQRVAADCVHLAAEVIAQKFPDKAMLDMSRMELPTNAQLERRVSEIEKAAKQEIEGLATKAERAAAQAKAQGQQLPPEAAQQAEQAAQAVVQKYSAMLAEAEGQVTVEQVMKLIRDDRTRSFVFEIESSSTILTDELQEKESRNEFLTQFTAASQGLAQIAAMGESGAKLAGEMLKFTLAPYRAGRTLDGAIDAFIKDAPEMAARMAQSQGDDGLAEANKTLAQAEMVKARADMARTEASARNQEAEMQRRMAEMQQKAQAEAVKAQQEQEKLRQQLADTQGALAKNDAEIDKLRAQTAQILVSIGLDARKQDLEEYRAAGEQQARVEDQSARAVDQDRAGDQQRFEQDQRSADADRADRQQDFSEQQARREAMNGGSNARTGG